MSKGAKIVPQRLNFTDHRRELDDNRYVYAVVSRRSRGLSIGINLNPDKACNFDCPYCQVDRTIPGGTRAIDADLLEQELASLFTLVQSGELWSRPPFDTAAPAMRVVRDVAIAGDGEPTACPDFLVAMNTIGTVLERSGWTIGAEDGIRFNLLTNATLFHRTKVTQALARFGDLGGEIWAKLDAGTQEYFEQVDGTRLSLDRVVNNIAVAAASRPLVLQCMFMRMDGQGPSEAEIDAWESRLKQILDAGGQVRLVQVYTVARRPADSRVSILPLPALNEIASRAMDLGLRTEVSPGVQWET